MPSVFYKDLVEIFAVQGALLVIIGVNTLCQPITDRFPLQKCLFWLQEVSYMVLMKELDLLIIELNVLTSMSSLEICTYG